MQKIKLTISLFILSLLISVSSVSAAVPLSITELPEYITTNTFKLSYSCLGCSSVQFYVSKNGGAWNAFGGAMTDASGQVQVTSTQVDEQTSYTFEVRDTSGATANTTTFYDISGPSPISGFYKERISDGAYKLHWVNPGDSDFAQVVIYRGDSQGYSADASHEIARVAGGANATMTYEDHFTPDSSKNYIYLIRALDRAGNSSSLAGDPAGTVTSASSPNPAPGSVRTLPGEQGSGSVLGTSASPSGSPTPEGALTNGGVSSKGGLFNWIFTHKKISLGILLVAAIIFVYLRKHSKKS